MAHINIGRNDPCPCGCGMKYKNCTCYGKTNWEKIINSGVNPIPHFSIKKRNLLFIHRIAEALKIDNEKKPLTKNNFKAAFTKDAVKQIYEGIVELWPQETKLDSILERLKSEVTGLHIGVYERDIISKEIVRHSLYANKIVLIDPFPYPLGIRDEYNPLLVPEKYRVQTLSHVLFWMSLIPWIEADVVEVIRTPGDFDRKLLLESAMRQKLKFESTPELSAALEQSANEDYSKRKEQELLRMLISAPDGYLRQFYEESSMKKDGVLFNDFCKFINFRRSKDPEFLEPAVPGEGQFRVSSTGTSYDMAKITAKLTGSYLVTDISARWKEMELDRVNNSQLETMWTPFSKALNDSSVHYLDNVKLEDALRLRKDGYLSGMRGFLKKTWQSACDVNRPFSEQNAKLLSEELNQEILKAEIEWKKIDQNLVKFFLAGGAATYVVSGGAGFLPAIGAAVAGGVGLLSAHNQRKTFQIQHPAGFFIKLKP